MSLSPAQNIFMPTNINSIVLLDMKNIKNQQNKIWNSISGRAHDEKKNDNLFRFFKHWRHQFNNYLNLFLNIFWKWIQTPTPSFSQNSPYFVDLYSLPLVRHCNWSKYHFSQHRGILTWSWSLKSHQRHEFYLMITRGTSTKRLFRKNGIHDEFTWVNAKI